MHSHNKQPKFITFEGIEGVGKSINIAFVKKLLDSFEQEVILTREPGGTFMAEAIREILLSHRRETVFAHTETLLLFAARVQHIHNTIQPALNSGKWVLCDRFTESTYAYQGAGRGLGYDLVALLEKEVINQFHADLVILLDAPVEVALKRAKNRSAQDRIESETIAFFQSVRQNYLDLAQKNPDRFEVIDATQPLSDIQSHLKQIILKFFPQKPKL